ncbi:hypothetical protein Slin15195_G123100 [Septoria linicola]|uniref:Uncharacterized protein n=1 Tax=Septoria linicola TaxID=215465 RepID=A0A9Q9B9T9_9PEZI|nr:hypothetical protein Slin15195_G123100 [Septoria linicola]
MPRRAETRNTTDPHVPSPHHLTLGIEQTQQQQHHPQPLHRILVKTNKNPNTSSQTATASDEGRYPGITAFATKLGF